MKIKTKMNITDELLQKYFDGATTLEEEKAIKAAFASGQISEQHRRYLPLFQSFLREQTEQMPVKESVGKRSGTLKFYSLRVLSLSAAACAVVLLTLKLSATPDDYMMVHGKRMNDPQMAREFSNAKLEKSLNVIKRNLAAYSDNKEVRQKLQEIEEQLQTSTNKTK
jgi:hypothetical protein